MLFSEGLHRSTKPCVKAEVVSDLFAEEDPQTDHSK
jgi:hypothetical protein